VRRDGQWTLPRRLGDKTPQTLRVRLAGRMKHGRIAARWQAAPVRRSWRRN
jgi:hypothetical protein